MLISDWVKIKWNKRHKKHFISKGYYFTKIGDEFLVKAEDLTKGSHVHILILCDYCLEEGIHTIISKTYKDYIQQNEKSNIHKDCCKKCQYKKGREVNNIKYGCNAPLQNEHIKNKSKQTSLKRYGTEYPMQNEMVKNNFKNTCQEKYGVDNVFQLEEVKILIKQTNLNKYGVEYNMQNKEIKQKAINTCLDKYGVEYYSQTDECKEKMKNTSLKNWNTEYPLQNKEIRERIKQTNISKYGYENSSQNKEIREKIQQTNLERYGNIIPVLSNDIKFKIINTNLNRYGCEYPFQSPIIREKGRNTLYQNGTCKTSTQQLYIYNLLKENNYNVELNYPLSRINLDVAIFIDNIKIDLEYDSWYFHKDKQKDRRRDEFVKSHGWKILRVRSGHLLPTLEQIKQQIEYLINNNKSFAQIILDDWENININ